MSIEAFTKLIPEYEGYPDEAIIRIECSVRELRQTANKISAQPEEFLQPTREEVEAEVVTDEEIRPRQEALLRRMEEMRKAESAQPERVSVPNKMPEDFRRWLCHEIRPGTVISNPSWWAPKIYSAFISLAADRKGNI